MIHDENELDEVLTRPRPVLVEFIRSVSSPLLVLGAGGKMGPTLAVLARRAAEARRPSARCYRGQPLLGRSSAALAGGARGQDAAASTCSTGTRSQHLPDAADVIYLVGLKFGTARIPRCTWAANTLVPAHVAERFAVVRIVALSTGNVYPLVPVTSGGARRDHAAHSARRIRQCRCRARTDLRVLLQDATGRGSHSSG